MYASDLLLVVDGDEYRLKASLSLAADGAFYGDIYGPFGSSVASVEGSGGAGEILAGGRSYTFAEGQTIGTIEGLAVIPFTFGRLVRILTGLHAAEQVPDRAADGNSAEGRTVSLNWELDTETVRVDISGSRCRPTRVVARGSDGGWHLEYADFDDGLPRYVRFGQDSANYFVLRHRKVTMRE